MTLQTVSAVTAGVAVVAGGIGAYLLMDDAGMFASRSGPRLLVSPGPTPTVLVRMEFF
ncbi:MAG: hypothetical protein M5R36_29640 [Deltaproteobacteria bacterium]|nr:hypothetical protein [Deltaproteobacteria bacterium]